MTDVFISYSRNDKAFVTELLDALKAKNYDAWIDWEGIASAAPNFLEEIYAGIEGADTFLLIMTPSSLKSEICNLEIAYALKHNKRIVPLVYIEVVSGNKLKPEIVHGWYGSNWEEIARTNWDNLSHINWLFLQDGDDFDAVIDTLIATLNTDLDHVKFHTRLTVRAREWEYQHQSDDFVLRGDDLTTAEGWFAISEHKEPAPTSLHRTYIKASVFIREQESRAAREQQERELALQTEVAQRQSQAATRLRFLLFGTVAFLLVAVGLSVFAFDRSRVAVNERDNASTQAVIADTNAISAATAQERAQIEADRSQTLAAEAVYSANQAQSLLLLNSAEFAQLTNPEFVLPLAMYASTITDPPGAVQSFLANAAYDFGVRYRTQNTLIYNIIGDDLLTAECEDDACTINRRTIRSSDVNYSSEMPHVADYWGDTQYPALEWSSDNNYLLAASPIVVSDLQNGVETITAHVELRYWNATSGEMGEVIQLPVATADVDTVEAIDLIREFDVAIVAHALDRSEVIVGSCIQSRDIFESNRINAVFTVNYQTGEITPWTFENVENCLLLNSSYIPMGFSVAYNVDGTHLNVVDCTGFKRLDLETFTYHLVEPDNNNPDCTAWEIEYSLDNEILVMAEAPHASVVDTRTARELIRLEDVSTRSPLSFVRITPDSQYLFLSSLFEDYRVYDLDGNELYQLDLGTLYQLHFLPANDQVIAQIDDENPVLFSIEDPSDRIVFDVEFDVESVVISPDEELILLGQVGVGGVGQVFSRSTGEPITDVFALEEGLVYLDNAGEFVVTGESSLDVIDISPFNPEQSHHVSSRILTTGPEDAQLLLAQEPGGVPMLLIYDVDSGEVETTFSRANTFPDIATESDDINAIYGSAVTPDGSQVLTSIMGYELVLIDIDTGDAVRYLGQAGSRVTGVAISPDGETGVSGDTSGTLTMWDMASGNRMGELEVVAADVHYLEFGTDSDKLYAWVPGGQSIFTWDVASGDMLEPLTHDETIIAVEVIPERIITVTQGGVISLWDRQSGTKLNDYELDIENVIDNLSLSASEDGRLLGVGLPYDTIFFFALSNDELTPVDIYTEIVEEQIMIIADDSVQEGYLFVTGGADSEPHYHVYGFDPEDGYGTTGELVSGEGFFIEYSTVSGRFISIYPDSVSLIITDIDFEAFDVVSEEINLERYNRTGHIFSPSDAAFSPDGGQLVSVGEDVQGFVWDVESGEIINHFSGHSKQVIHVEFSPDGQWILTNDDEIRILDAADLSLSQELAIESEDILAIAWDVESSMLATGATNGHLALWDVGSGEAIWQHARHSDHITAVAVQQSRARIASGGVRRVINIWDAEDGSFVFDLHGHTAGVTALAFSVSDNLLISGAADGEVIIWDISTEQPIRRYTSGIEIEQIIVDEDGMITVVGGDQIDVWLYQDLNELMDWICTNRYVTPLPEDQRRRYRLENAPDLCPG